MDTLNKIQDIVRSGNSEGVGRPAVQTFIFIWAYGKNSVREKQSDLSIASGINARTLRAHLSELEECAWIEYTDSVGGNDDGKSISLKRFKH